MIAIFQPACGCQGVLEGPEVKPCYQVLKHHVDYDDDGEEAYNDDDGDDAYDDENDNDDDDPSG